MKKSLRYIKKSIFPYRFVIIALLTFGLLFTILFLQTVKLPGSDDFVFPAAVAHYPNVIGWVQHRYMTWSGRVFTEAGIYYFNKLPFMFWKLASLSFYLISTIYLFLYFRLWSATNNARKDIIVFSICAMLPLLIGIEVLHSSIFWFTGSMNYFWTAAFGLIGLYPLAFLIKNNRLPGMLFSAMSTVFLFAATSSQEQVGFSLFMISLGLLGYVIYKHKGTSLLYYLVRRVLPFVLVSLFGLIVGLAAPGNALRLKSEVANWQPDFYSTPILQHLNFSSRWFLEAFLHHTGYLLVFIVAIGFLLYLKSEAATPSQKKIAIYGATIVTTALLLVDRYSLSARLYNFKAVWKSTDIGIYSDIAVVFWFITIALLVIAPLIIYKKKSRGLLISLLLAVSILSTLILVVSPTMYASEWRTLFVPSYTLSLVMLLLFSDLYDNYRDASMIVFVAISTLATIVYFAMITHLA